MEDIIKDEVVGSLRFHNGVWGRRLDAPVFNSDGNLILVFQDPNKEGILDIQKEAFKRYLQNEEGYKNRVTNYILEYYKWYYEEIKRIVSDLGEEDHKEVIDEKGIYELMDIWYLFICRDGSFGYAFDCCWDGDNGLAVLLSEDEPRVISRTQLENFHKLNDPTLGLLVHDGKNAWKGLERNSFFGKLENLEIELEGGVDEGITSAQQKAYEKYLQNKENYFKEFSKMMLKVYSADEERAADMVQGKIKVTVGTALPKTLFIDKEGNYGWICYTAWNDSYIGVLLSDDKPYLMSCDKLRNYAREEKLKDEVLGIVFPSYVGFENIVVVRLVDEVYTLPLVVGSYDKVITEEIRQAYITFLMMRGTFWTKMREKMLEYYLDVYDDLEENLEIPDHFKRKNISQQNVLDMVMFTKLYISPKGRVAWLAEAPTDEEDGIAFEFTNGEIKLITQPEII